MYQTICHHNHKYIMTAKSRVFWELINVTRRVIIIMPGCIAEKVDFNKVHFSTTHVKYGPIPNADAMGAIKVLQGLGHITIICSTLDEVKRALTTNFFV
jgi:hypothetical protein